MSLLWPSRLNPDPDIVVRFGRALHWLGTLIGLAFVVTGGCISLANAGDSTGLVFFSLIGAPFLIGGRLARYIFSAE